MKKKLLIMLAFVAVIAGASSCSKTCHCITEYIGWSEKEPFEEDLQVDKNTTCSSLNQSKKIGSGEMKMTCTNKL
ncbi:MAG: hypothetical protein HUJ92_05335 [Bacteroidales bacterium]|nr:hypothetical protein [Bacteroidales bacterium]